MAIVLIARRRDVTSSAVLADFPSHISGFSTLFGGNRGIRHECSKLAKDGDSHQILSTSPRGPGTTQRIEPLLERKPS